MQVLDQWICIQQWNPSQTLCHAISPRMHQGGGTVSDSIGERQGPVLPKKCKGPSHFYLRSLRAVLDREINRSATDEALLRLERMRMIDTLHYWSVGTHKTYQGKLRFLSDGLSGGLGWLFSLQPHWSVHLSMIQSH